MLGSLDPLGSEPDEWPLSDAWLLVLEDWPDECPDESRLCDSADDPESERDETPLLPDDLPLADADDCSELGTLDLSPEELADDRESNEPLRDETDDWPDDCEPEDLLADDLLDWLLEDALGRLTDDPEDLASDERDESDVVLSLPDDRLRREDDVLLPDASLVDGLLLLDQGLSLE